MALHFPKSLVLPSRSFLLLAIIVLIAVRVMIVLASPAYDGFGDLSIYREVGELVVNGVDPYNAESKRDLREALRLNGHGLPTLDVSKPLYDYYVGGNLPASTLLYGLIEWLSQGSIRGWRLILIGGDLALLLATYVFLRRNGIALDRLQTQFAFALSIIWYPSLLCWGTLHAEDKQFQTALMVALAAMLATSGRAPRLNAAWIGIVGGLSVFFKVFGIFLAPLALQFFLRRPRRELVIAISAAVALALPLLFSFDHAFLVNMFGRFSLGASTVTDAYHASPWTLFAPGWARYLRPLVTVALIGLSIAAYVRGRIDLLNCCAAICVAFVCLWLVGGSMDRLNIAMIFALVCTATISLRAWLLLSVINCVAQFPLYLAIVQKRNYIAGLSPEMPDAVAAFIFVVSYYSIILLTESDQKLSDRAERPIGQ